MKHEQSKQREIKFRAWHYGAKVMLQVGDESGTTHPLDCCKYAQEGQPIELEQYTGLKDANGVEIYEGDVFCDCDGDVLVVGWSKESMMYFYYDPTNKIPDDALCDAINPITVIGNIHENPELLETK